MVIGDLLWIRSGISDLERRSRTAMDAEALPPTECLKQRQSLEIPTRVSKENCDVLHASAAILGWC
jgi:hypothetical protein